MKDKSILLILLFFILANCGFEPIYSSKKSNFNIGEIKITNKNKFNSQGPLGLSRPGVASTVSSSRSSAV